NSAKAMAPLQTRVTSWGQRIVGGGDVRTATRKREPGMALARCVRATAAAKFQGGGVDLAVNILKSWGDHDLAEDWATARQKALNAGDATAGGFLVPIQYSQDFIT